MTKTPSTKQKIVEAFLFAVMATAIVMLGLGLAAAAGMFT